MTKKKDEKQKINKLDLLRKRPQISRKDSAELLLVVPLICPLAQTVV